MSDALEVRQGAEVARAGPGPADVSFVVNRVALMQQVFRTIMQPDVHYGSIPGTGKGPDGKPKKVLFKPGAEILNVAFQFASSFPAERIHRVLEKDFILYEVSCVLTHMGTGVVVGEGVGLCSSREDKYAWRKGSIACPDCGAEAIIKGKAEYGGGWICYKVKGGCGKKWPNEDAFDAKSAAKAPNENIYEQANTILKMAEKRALVAATLNATAASDIFTQDLAEFVEAEPQAGWNGTGSKEAQAEVVREKLKGTKYESEALPQDADLLDIQDDDIPPDAPKSARRRKTTNYDWLALVKAQKETIVRLASEADYRSILQSFGVKKSNELTVPEDQEKLLKALRITALELEMKAAGGKLYDDPNFVALFKGETSAMRQANYCYAAGKKGGQSAAQVDEVVQKQVDQKWTAAMISDWWQDIMAQVQAKSKTTD